MVRARVLAAVSTAAFVGGALLVGDALHRTLAAGGAPLGDAGTRIAVLVGLVVIGAGYVARRAAGPLTADDDESPNRPGGTQSDPLGNAPDGPPKRGDERRN